MIENHPQDAHAIIIDAAAFGISGSKALGGALKKVTKGYLSENYNTWMLRLKDQVNLGETPTDTSNVTAAEGISLPAEVTNLLIRAQSATAGNINVLHIEPGFDGQRITVEGMDATKTITLTTGGNIKLNGGAPLILGLDAVISLHFNKAKNYWFENSRSVNS